jgi:hypothetical protein
LRFCSSYFYCLSLSSTCSHQHPLLTLTEYMFFTFCERPDFTDSCILCTCVYVESGKTGPCTLNGTNLPCRPRLKCDGTRAETRFRLSAKRTSPFKSAGASVQSTAGSRAVHISGSNAGYTMFRGSVKGTGYPLHSPLSPYFPSRASPCAITFQLDST